MFRLTPAIDVIAGRDPATQPILDMALDSRVMPANDRRDRMRAPPGLGHSYSALTMSSTIFLASANSIIVLLA